MPAGEKGRIVRFATFEVDLQSGELRQKGLKVRLQGQPFQILATLLERPGEVVTREELRLRLWPTDTFVDFDHSLNAAVKRLRESLGDSAETPTFIETLARRGYRFLGNVEILPASPSSLSEVKSNPPSAYHARSPKWQFGVAVLAIVAVAGMVAGLLRWRSASRSLPQVSPTLQRLTTNGAQNWIIASAISPDGKYLAFSDKTGIYLRLLSTGELHALVPKISDATSLGWFPDGSHVLASWTTTPGKKGLWAVSILGGNARQLGDEGWSASVSSDGSQIVFLKGADFADVGHEIWVMRANGADPRKLVSFPGGHLASPVWSPDGRWIAYVRNKPEPDAEEPEIDIFNLKQGASQVLLSQHPVEVWGMTWLPDGRLVYAMDEPPPSQNSSNFWAAHIDLSSGRFVGTAARITSGDGFVVQPSVTTDSKHLVFNRARPQSDVYISEFSAKGARLSTPRQLTFDEAYDLPFDWTIDNQSVLFISDRTGMPNVFRQRIDGTSAEMLVIDQEKKAPICRLTPDGSQILYSVPMNPGDNLGPVRLMRAPLKGGPPHIVLEAPAIGNFECSHTPATICAFGQEKPDELVISIFDPAIGEPHVVATLQAGWGWGLSPDGKSIAASTFGPTNNRIRLLSLAGQPTREVTVKNWSGFTSLDWAADSKGFFINSNPAGLRQSLLYVDLAGNAHQIWQVNHVWPSWAIPSRNGKYLAILGPTMDSNVWMAESF
ncbi:MAG TPA: winged helix-turn-helix domain-containing protein [Candidatus Sulfotelmatobacter sp.]|nr:winged helix-turn-helix domain-containing protein [Candidatus Sulfotelmatobacter sp.]